LPVPLLSVGQFLDWEIIDPACNKRLYPVGGETGSNHLDNYVEIKNYTHSDFDLKIESEFVS
jgi:hypothetical protein